jgi:hypothetical protein
MADQTGVVLVDAKLIFHDCGELITEMVQQFAVELGPVMLSLGSSRKLWYGPRRASIRARPAVPQECVVRAAATRPRAESVRPHAAGSAATSLRNRTLAGI